MKKGLVLLNALLSRIEQLEKENEDLMKSNRTITKLMSQGFAYRDKVMELQTRIACLKHEKTLLEVALEESRKECEAINKEAAQV